MELELKFCRELVWHFVIINIIGIAFLSHYNLLAETRNRCLLGAVTHISAKGQVANGVIESIRIIVDDFLFHQLLTQYPILTSQLYSGKECRSTRWNIILTPHQDYLYAAKPGNWRQTATKQRRTG